MIPAQNIVAWSHVAPWAEQRQIEQDLIISRALIDLFSDPFLSEELRFRGGTALNKLHFPRPLRYSEDIDLVRTSHGGMVPDQERSVWRLHPATISKFAIRGRTQDCTDQLTSTYGAESVSSQR